MIIPVRCFTCGKVLADKWNFYERRCRELGDEKPAEPPAHRLGGAASSGADAPGAPQLQPGGGYMIQKTVRGKVLDELGLTNNCCRTIMLTHVDMSDII